jgi:hypothetical protein
MLQRWPDVGHGGTLCTHKPGFCSHEALQTFLVALSALFFRNTSLITQLVSAVIEGATVAFILWCIWNSWSDRDGQAFFKIYSQALITRTFRLVVQKHHHTVARELETKPREMEEVPRFRF